ncbi:unnamed protein product [Ambrosiozyma monospora]|uniref:Unnamed protein product n=1 Tax=Ambrosiozyma monospora TaxID=43982 RepID=A0ACB5TQT9_AMBMO|nr:unnamed protein product [Ambrosiozyma monospora]
MTMTAANMFSDDEDDDDYNDFDSVCYHTQNKSSGITTPNTSMSMSTNSSRVVSDSNQIERDQSGVIVKGIVSSAVVQERLVQRADSITSGKPPPPLPQRRRYSNSSTLSFGYTSKQQRQNQPETQHRLEEILDKVNVNELQTGLDSLRMLCCGGGSSAFNPSLSASENEDAELQSQPISRSSSGSSFIGTGTTKSTKQKLIANSIAMIVDSISNDREMLKLVIDQLGDGCFENGKRMMSPVKFQLLKMINSQTCDNTANGNGTEKGMNTNSRRRSNTVSVSRRKSIERLNQEGFVESDGRRASIQRKKQWYGDVSEHTVDEDEIIEDDQEFECKCHRPRRIASEKTKPKTIRTQSTPKSHYHHHQCHSKHQRQSDETQTTTTHPPDTAIIPLLTKTHISTVNPTYISLNMERNNEIYEITEP